MKQFVSNNNLILKYAGSLLLTSLVVFVLFCILSLLMKIHASFLTSQSQLHNTSIYVAPPSHPAVQDSYIHPFWPQFPRNTASIIHGEVINGVQILTEDWESSASASDIFYYYRQQMIARGWQDVTEKTFSLQPEQIYQEMGGNALQDEKYVAFYRNIMDSNLVLSHGKWTMHITTKPAKQKEGFIAVEVCAVATPSIKNFSESLAANFTRNVNEGQINRPFDAVQHSGGQRYHTTIKTSSKAPALALQESLAKLGAQGWHPVMFLPQQAQSGYFAWLVRGKEYAALSVNALPQGKSSSVTFTEVTPD